MRIGFFLVGQENKRLYLVYVKCTRGHRAILWLASVRTYCVHQFPVGWACTIMDHLKQGILLGLPLSISRRVFSDFRTNSRHPKYWHNTVIDFCWLKKKCKYGIFENSPQNALLGTPLHFSSISDGLISFLWFVIFFMIRWHSRVQ